MKEKFEPEPQAETGGRIKEKMEELGWKIYGPFYSEAPIPNPELIERCQESADRLAYHILQTVIIDDGFGVGYGAREQFYKQRPNIGSFNKKFGKLTGTKLYACYADMDNIIGKNRKNKQVQTALTEAAQLPYIEQKLAEYNTMPLDEKINFANKMDEIIFQFLSILSQF